MLDSKKEIVVLDAELIAHIKSKMADKIVISRYYKTLFYGLKLDHPMKVALVHPLFFILRRILFVAALAYFVTQPMFAVLVFLSTTFVMLIFGVHER